MASVWVRRIGKTGNGYTVALPVEAMRAMGWERGDHVLVRAATPTTLAFTKYKPHELPDRVREACAELDIDHA